MSAEASGAREAVLGRIRRALGTGARADSQSGLMDEEDMAAAWGELPREYDRRAERSRPEVLELLEDRLRDYDAHVERVPVTRVAEAIARRLSECGWPAMLVPAGFPETMLPDGVEFSVDHGLTPQELDRFAGVLTTATVAIALTGTLVLQDVAGQGRRAATLIPDYHLCVLRESDVVETVPEAMARLAPTATRPTTFISGPSATADIEMTRIKGVHGPRVLEVLLVAEESL